MGRRRAAISIFALLLMAGVVEAKPKLSSSEYADLKKQIQRSLRGQQYDAAVSKIRAIGQDDSKRAIDFLAGVAKIPDAQVYNAARDAVAGMSSAEAKAHILKRMKSGNPIAKMLLVDAMGVRADRFAGEALGIAVQSRQAEVQRAAISTIRRKKLSPALGGLIELLAKLEKGEAGLNLALVRETLDALTGQHFDKADQWRKWWDINRANFRPSTGKRRAQTGKTAGRKRPRFFGSELRSNRLVFVIDTSGSMEAADPPSAGGNDRDRGPLTGGQGGAPQPKSTSRVRIERAKFQLQRVIDMLPKKARFTILAYNGVLLMGANGPVLPPGAKPGQPLPPKMGQYEWLKTWKPKLMPATKKNKADAKKFVSGLKATGGTFTMNAIKAAMQIKGADTLVVLSDGMPNDVDMKSGQQMPSKKILDEIGAVNRFRRVIIDTFGFDPASGRARGRGMPGGFGRGRRGSGGGFGRGRGGGGGGVPAGFGGLGKFMQDLAGQNGGKYTQIK